MTWSSVRLSCKAISDLDQWASKNKVCTRRRWSLVVFLVGVLGVGISYSEVDSIVKREEKLEDSE